jgi:hypothetical protein
MILRFASEFAVGVPRSQQIRGRCPRYGLHLTPTPTCCPHILLRCCTPTGGCINRINVLYCVHENRHRTQNWKLAAGGGVPVDRPDPAEDDSPPGGNRFFSAPWRRNSRPTGFPKEHRDNVLRVWRLAPWGCSPAPLAPSATPSRCPSGGQVCAERTIC